MIIQRREGQNLSMGIPDCKEPVSLRLLSGRQVAAMHLHDEQISPSFGAVLVPRGARGCVVGGIGSAHLFDSFRPASTTGS